MLTKLTTLTTLTTRVQLGAYPLKNRLVMPLLTRLRNSAEGVPPQFAAEYYGQRANSESRSPLLKLTGQTEASS